MNYNLYASVSAGLWLAAIVLAVTFAASFATCAH